MKPEELKVIAEGMGYISGLNGYMEPCFYKLGGRHPEEIEYTPLTNNDQMVEIMEKLKISIWFDGVTWVAQIKNNNRSLEDTINEAVCKAAYEYFKDK